MRRFGVSGPSEEPLPSEATDALAKSWRIEPSCCRSTLFRGSGDQPRRLHFVLCKRRRLCYTLPAREHV